MTTAEAILNAIAADMALARHLPPSERAKVDQLEAVYAETFANLGSTSPEVLAAFVLGWTACLGASDDAAAQRGRRYTSPTAMTGRTLASIAQLSGR